MANKDEFLQKIKEGYAFKTDSVQIGTAMLNAEVIPGANVLLPLKTMNRHGLIAGATGTGKTKTLQLISEGLSAASVPVLLMDIKGDLSGIAAAGKPGDKIIEMFKQLGISFKPSSFPVEFVTGSNEKGTRMRATVSEFGPVLLSKRLGLKDSQGGVVAV